MAPPAACRRARRMLALAALTWAGGCASHAGGRATEGALEALRAEPPPGASRPAERIGRDVVDGALNQLSSPDGLARMGVVVDAGVRRTLEVALRAPSPAARTAGAQGRAAPSLVQRVSRDSATAFSLALSDQLRHELGPDGRGLLAQSVAATTEEVSGAAVRGVRNELSDLFPECAGEARRGCLELGVRSLGKAAASGFVEGLVGSGAWLVAAIAFVVGVLVAMGVRAAWRPLRRGRPAT